MRSISSPVPTGTVDLVTTTAVAGQQRRDLPHRTVDEAQIGVTVAAARRRADGDEHHVGFAECRSRLAANCEPPLPHVGFDELGEARLENRNFAAIERRDPPGILVDAGHVVTEIGKAGAGNKADIAGADHGHAHKALRGGADRIRTGRWY